MERFVPEERFVPDLKNRAKNHPKVSKIGPKSILEAKMHPEDVFSSFCYIFGRFLEAQGPPKMEPKSLKVVKSSFKNDVKKRHLLEHGF